MHPPFVEAGPRECPAIVLLHGGGLSGRAWAPQLDALRERFHVLVPDLAEQGANRSAGPFTLDDSAAQIAALVRDRVPSGRAHVVGLSLGGAVALTAMRTQPETVDRVMVSGTAAGLGRVLAAIARATARLNDLLPRAWLVDATVRQFRIPPAYATVVREDLVTSAAFTRHVVDALATMQFPLESRAPVLVAVGARETIPAHRAARTLASRLANATGVVVPGVGHVWNLENPVLFNSLVTNWVLGEPLPEGVIPMNPHHRSLERVHHA